MKNANNTEPIQNMSMHLDGPVKASTISGGLTAKYGTYEPEVGPEFEIAKNEHAAKKYTNEVSKKLVERTVTEFAASGDDTVWLNCQETLKKTSNATDEEKKAAKKQQREIEMKYAPRLSAGQFLTMGKVAATDENGSVAECIQNLKSTSTFITEQFIAAQAATTNAIKTHLGNRSTIRENTEVLADHNGEEILHACGFDNFNTFMPTTHTEIDRYNSMVGTINQKINEYNQANQTRVAYLTRLVKLPFSEQTTATDMPFTLQEADERAKYICEIYNSAAENLQCIVSMVSSDQYFDLKVKVSDVKYLLKKVFTGLPVVETIFANDAANPYITVSKDIKYIKLCSINELLIANGLNTITDQLRKNIGTRQDAYTEALPEYLSIVRNELHTRSEANTPFYHVTHGWADVCSGVARLIDMLSDASKKQADSTLINATNILDEIRVCNTAANRVSAYYASVSEVPKNIKMNYGYLNLGRSLSFTAIDGGGMVLMMHAKSKQVMACIIDKLVNSPAKTLTELLSSTPFSDEDTILVYEPCEPAYSNVMRTDKNKEYLASIGISPEILDCINRILNGKTLPQNVTPDSLIEPMSKVIEFLKERIPCLNGNTFKLGSHYDDAAAMTDDINSGLCSVKLHHISEEALIDMVQCGKVHVFDITFSDKKNSKFKQILEGAFDEHNFDMSDVKLCGNIRISYMPPTRSVSDCYTHKYGETLVNRNFADKSPVPDDIWLNIWAHVKFGEELTDAAKDVIEKYPYLVHPNKYGDITEDYAKTFSKYKISIPVQINKFKTGNHTVEFLKLIKDNGVDNVIGVDVGENRPATIAIVNRNDLTDVNFITVGNQQFSTSHHKRNNATAEYDKRRSDAKQHNKLDSGNTLKNRKKNAIENTAVEVLRHISKVPGISVIVKENYTIGNTKNCIARGISDALVETGNHFSNKHRDPYAKGGVLNPVSCTNGDPASKLSLNGSMWTVRAQYTSGTDYRNGFCNTYRFTQVRNDSDYAKLKEDVMRIIKSVYMEGENMAYVTNDGWLLYGWGERVDRKRKKLVKMPVIYQKFISKYNINTDANMLDQILQHADKTCITDFVHQFKVALTTRNTLAAEGIDFIISPVKCKDGSFFDSRNYTREQTKFPLNGDDNGSYGISLSGVIVSEKVDSMFLDGVDVNDVAKFNTASIDWDTEWKKLIAEVAKQWDKRFNM